MDPHENPKIQAPFESNHAYLLWGKLLFPVMLDTGIDDPSLFSFFLEALMEILNRRLMLRLQLKNKINKNIYIQIIAM